LFAGGGLEAAPLERGEQECVDRVPPPGRIPYGRHIRSCERAVAPGLLRLISVITGGIVHDDLDRFAPGRAHLDPARERRDVFGVELALRGHLVVLVAVADHREEPAVPRRLEVQRGARIAAREDARPARERQPAADPFPAAMASETLAREDREDVLREERRGLVARRVGPVVLGPRRADLGWEHSREGEQGEPQE